MEPYPCQVAFRHDLIISRSSSRPSPSGSPFDSASIGVQVFRDRTDTDTPFPQVVSGIFLKTSAVICLTPDTVMILRSGMRLKRRDPAVAVDERGSVIYDIRTQRRPLGCGHHRPRLFEVGARETRIALNVLLTESILFEPPLHICILTELYLRLYENSNVYCLLYKIYYIMSAAWLGKHLSEEHKRKISESSRGRKLTEEHKKRISLAMEGNPKIVGKVISDETRRKIGEASSESIRKNGHPMQGKHHSEEARLAISIRMSGENNPNFGRKHTEEERKAISQSAMGHKRCVGRVLSEETRAKISKSMKGKMSGEKCPNWKGGISFAPYCPKFNKEFKERVRSFFGRKCVLCGKTEEENRIRLSIHHVNYNKMTCCDDTRPLFVALCVSCHAKTNFNASHWEDYFTKVIENDYNGVCY
jgi:hypothetical protein